MFPLLAPWSLASHRPQDAAALSEEVWVTSAASHPALKALPHHPAIFHVPAALTLSYIKTIHQEEGVSVR